MPKYDYKCSACGVVYEKREGFDAPSVQACPECSGEARRVLTPPAIVFKGSGWYVTDSRKGSLSDAKGESAGTDKSEGKSESNDTKPAASSSAAPAPAAAAD